MDWQIVDNVFYFNWSYVFNLKNGAIVKSCNIEHQLRFLARTLNWWLYIYSLRLYTVTHLWYPVTKFGSQIFKGSLPQTIKNKWPHIQVILASIIEHRAMDAIFHYVILASIIEHRAMDAIFHYVIFKLVQCMFLTACLVSMVIIYLRN